MELEANPASARVTVRRRPQRAAYDRSTIDSILDEALICHVGFTEDDQPFVIPTIFARDGDRVLIHGSNSSRMLRVARSGVPLCVTVTLLDGIVLARSAFHHSMNYRSVVILGRATEVSESVEKTAAMRVIFDHVVAGRWDEVRPPSTQELNATSVLAIPISEASAKVRTGPPLDDERDYRLGVWAGVIPLTLDAHAPVSDPRLSDRIPAPSYARFYRRTPLNLNP
jgi:nitroimidazol reductase NimA-like FMN-containing flavoprotein (pyridoxamine 5'-phosphate oxidase superfamily)